MQFRQGILKGAKTHCGRKWKKVKVYSYVKKLINKEETTRDKEQKQRQKKRLPKRRKISM